jgi:uncharacterized coiled-coil protein SlyX
VSSGGADAVDDLAGIFGKITWGSVPTWIQVCILLLILWKGVPAFLDAISNRQSKVEERMEARLKDSDERYLKQIEAADRRHEDCMKANETLSERIDALEERDAKKSKIIAENGDLLVVAQQTIVKQSEEIAGLKRQIVQMQVSTLRVAPHTAADGVMDHMLTQLDQVASKRASS